MAIKWVRKDSGYYVSACGRWRICAGERRGKRWGEWYLYDKTRKHPLQPNYDWSEACHDLRNAKATAERLAAQLPAIVGRACPACGEDLDQYSIGERGEAGFECTACGWHDRMDADQFARCAGLTHSQIMRAEEKERERLENNHGWDADGRRLTKAEVAEMDRRADG